MPSNTPTIYTGKEILVAYYNKKKNLNLSVDDVIFDVPQRVDIPGSLSNSSVRLFHKLGTPYVGSPKIYYDRIHVSYLGTITIEKGTSTRLYQLLPAINSKYNISITPDDVEDEFYGSIGGGEILVNLKIKESSVTYYDGDIIYTPRYPNPNTGIRPEVDVYGFWDPETSSDQVVITNDRLTAEMDSHHLARCGVPVTSNKAFWEVKVDSVGLMIGVAVDGAAVTNNPNRVVGMDDFSWGLDTSTGKFWNKGVGLNYCPPVPVGTTVGVLLDVKGGILTYQIGNTVYNIAAIGFEQYDKVYPVTSGNGSAISKGTANFGQNPMTLTPPVDYARGVYTIKTVIPPSGGGDGGDYPPAGTVFKLYCEGLDRWGVFADGRGGANVVLVQANSTACGAIPTITATISNTPTSVTIVKGNIVETVYTLSNAVEEIVDFDTLIEYVGSANSTYHDTFRVKIGNGPFENIVSNRISLPAGDDTFTVRTTISAGILPLVGDAIHFKLKVNEDYSALVTTQGWLNFNINIQNSSIPPEGMLLSAHCNGFDKIGVYADGLGGSYEELIESNSEDCGYVPFVDRTIHVVGTGSFSYETNSDTVTITAKGGPGTDPSFYLSSGITPDSLYMSDTPSPTEGYDGIGVVDGFYYLSMEWSSTDPVTLWISNIDTGRTTQVYSKARPASALAVRAHNLHRYQNRSLVFVDAKTLLSTDLETWTEVDLFADLKNQLPILADYSLSSVGFIRGQGVTYHLSKLYKNGGYKSVVRFTTDLISWTVPGTVTQTSDNYQNGPDFGNEFNNSGSEPFVLKTETGWISIFVGQIGRVINENIQYFNVIRYKTTTDLLTWSNVTTLEEPVVSQYSGSVYYKKIGKLHTFSHGDIFVDTEDFTNWRVREAVAPTPFPPGGDMITFGNETFIRRTRYGLSNIYYYSRSDDLITWSGPGEIGLPDQNSPVVFSDGYFYTLIDVNSPSNRWRLYYSDDGKNWQVRLGIFPDNYNGVRHLFHGGLFHDSELAIIGGPRIIFPNGRGDYLARNDDRTTGQSSVVRINGVPHTFEGSYGNVPTTYRTDDVTITANTLDIEYDLVDNTFLSLEFRGRKTNVDSPAGTILSTDCDGFDKAVVFSDGNNNHYELIVEPYSEDCGYIRDTEKSVVLVGNATTTIPPGIEEITLKGTGSNSVVAVYETATSDLGLQTEVILTPGYNKLFHSKFERSDISYNFSRPHNWTIWTGDYWVRVGKVGSVDVANAVQASYNLIDWVDKIVFDTEINYLDTVLDPLAYCNGRFFLVVNNMSGGFSTLMTSTNLVDWVTCVATGSGTYQGNIRSSTKNSWCKYTVDGYHFSNSDYGYLSRDGINFTGTGYSVELDVTKIGNYHFISGSPYEGTYIRIHDFTYEYQRILTPINKNVISYNGEARGYMSPMVGNADGTIAISIYLSVVNHSYYLNAPYKKYGWYQRWVIGKPDEVTIYKLPDFFIFNSSSPVDGSAPTGEWQYTLQFVDGHFVMMDGCWLYYSSDALTWHRKRISGEHWTTKPILCANSGEKLYYGVQDYLYRVQSVKSGDVYQKTPPHRGSEARVAINDEIYRLPSPDTNPVPQEYTIPLESDKETKITHLCPGDSDVRITYIGVDDQAPPAGTLLGTTCHGYDQYGQYATGGGGVYERLIEINSLDCGYVIPPITTRLITTSETATCREGEYVDVEYFLTVPLDVEIGLTYQVEYITAQESSIEKYEIRAGTGTFNPVAHGDEVMFSAGVSSITIRTFVVENMVTEPEAETLKISLVPTTNADRVTEYSDPVTISIVDTTKILLPGYLVTNGDTDLVGTYIDRIAYTDNKHIVVSSTFASAKKYYIEFDYLDIDNAIVGVCDQDTVTDSASEIYPGSTNTSWGFGNGVMYHNGTGETYGASWEETTVGLFIDLDAKEIQLALNGVKQATAVPIVGDSFSLALGNKNSNDDQISYIVNLGNNQPKYPPPSGWYFGFGDLVEPAEWVEPAHPAKNVLVPAKVDTALSAPGIITKYENRIVVIEPGKSAVLDFSTSVGDFEFEVIPLTNSVFRVGLATSDQTLADLNDPNNTLVGSTPNSWGISSDFNHSYHSGVETTITPSISPRRNSGARLRFRAETSLLENKRNDDLLVSGVPTGLKVMVSVHQSAQNPIPLYINVGQDEFMSPANSTVCWPGVGSPLIPARQGMFIRTYCSGTDSVSEFANGSGGINTAVRPEARECGWVDENSYWNESTTENIIFPNSPDEIDIEFQPGTYMVLGNAKTKLSGGGYWEVFDNNVQNNPTIAGENVYIGIAYINADHTVVPGSDTDSIAIELKSGIIYHNGQEDTTIADIFAAAGAGYNLVKQTIGLEYIPSTKSLWVISKFLTDDVDKIRPGFDHRVEIPFKLEDARDIVPMIGYNNQVAGYDNFQVYYDFVDWSQGYAMSKNIGPVGKMDGVVSQYWYADMTNKLLVELINSIETRMKLSDKFSTYGLVSGSEMYESGVYYWEFNNTYADKRLVIGVVSDGYWTQDQVLGNPNATILHFRDIDDGLPKNTVFELGVRNPILDAVDLTRRVLGFEYDNVNNTLTIISPLDSGRWTLNAPTGPCRVYVGVVPNPDITAQGFDVNLGQDGFILTPPAGYHRLFPFVNTATYWDGSWVNRQQFNRSETEVNFHDQTQYTIRSKETLVLNQSGTYGVSVVVDEYHLGFVGLAKTSVDLTVPPGSTSDQVILSFNDNGVVSNGVLDTTGLTGLDLSSGKLLLAIDGQTGLVQIYVGDNPTPYTFPVNPFVSGDEICIIAGQYHDTETLNMLTVNFGQYYAYNSHPIPYTPIIPETWNNDVWEKPVQALRYTFSEPTPYQEEYSADLDIGSAEYRGVLGSSALLEPGNKYAFEFLAGSIAIGLVPENVNIDTDITQSIIDGDDPTILFFRGNADDGMIVFDGISYDAFYSRYWEDTAWQLMLVLVDLENNEVVFKNQNDDTVTVPIPSNTYRIVCVSSINEAQEEYRVNLGKRVMSRDVPAGYSTLHAPISIDRRYFEASRMTGYLRGDGTYYYSGTNKSHVVYTNQPFATDKRIYWEFDKSGNSGICQGLADYALFSEEPTETTKDPLTEVGFCGYHNETNTWFCDGVSTQLPSDVATNSRIGLDYDPQTHVLELLYKDSNGIITRMGLDLPTKTESSDYRLFFGYSQNVTDIEDKRYEHEYALYWCGAEMNPWYEFVDGGIPPGYTRPLEIVED